MISRYYLRWYGLFLSAFSLAWVSCSTTKDTFVNRTFHDLSAHYNGYYNAGLKLEEGKTTLYNSQEDRYDRILSVFKYGSVEKAKTVYPLMDDAMKRTSTVITRHTIVDKRGNEKPNSEKWIDDNWLLYGQAQFFKHDYIPAIETFKYVEATYQKEPTRHLASMWLAKIYLQLAQLNEVEAKLDYLRNQSDFPNKKRWELEATNADYYLQIKNYTVAIQHLVRAAASAPKREDRIRFMFILAQLYQQDGDFKKAFQMYTKVIKMNPKYEMAFNSRINRARCYDATSENSAEVKKELLKMEKDPKNREYLDQIYYALAGLSKQEGNEAAQIEYLNKSVQSSSNNPTQKSLSYLELGKIAYAKPDYRIAQVYYDSAITNLPNDYPDYTDILTRRNSLTKLVKYLNTINIEDSLQALSRLSPEEQENMVSEKLRKAEEEKARLKREEEEAKQSSKIFGNVDQDAANQFNKAGGANWYFYNQQAISFGFNEFAKKWGFRKLEDNWRRVKKQTQMPGIEDENLVTDTIAQLEIKDPKLAAEKKKQDMLKTIPSSPEALKKSETKVIEAYYNAAMLYKEQLKDPTAAIKMFEEMLAKHPKNKYELPAYFQLYRLYAQTGNMEKSDYYKNIILNDYPKSDYAEIIRNPNYAAELANKKSDLELFYEDTYRKYLSGDYNTVMRRKLEADVQFPQNKLTPQFDYLKTLSIGKTQSLSMFETSLQDIVRNYSGDPVKDAAENILDYIRNSSGKKADTLADSGPAADTAANKRAFNYFPDTMHYVIVLFQSIGGAINGEQYKAKLSDFNRNNFGTMGFNFSDLMFDHRMKIVVIKSFPDKTAAMQYNNQLLDNDDVYGNISVDNYQQYVISVNNYPELLRQKKTDEYEDFYRMFYR